ncbi:aminoglycoside phosphotransferase family protein [Burkholderia cenocepacia]|uniref:aminoglycoside phosphotransferase family protein n=1 Tax=Burkholderia cenocepacia TaxID=95486 RepID=UPI00264B7820|nr:aminoglycoside phosphotransferase family protein [Burkholderia cenocepacia]MDN7624312.1 aminoglycoside phosphotransferase family protein [Burkholderia cenocepacia]
MKDLSSLEKLIRADHLRLVVERDGVFVAEALTSHGKVFVKATTNRTAFDRHCEILEALEASSFAPRILEKTAWGEYAVVVLSAISGTRLDHVLKNAERETKLRLAAAAGPALAQLHRAIPPSRLMGMTCWQQRDERLERPAEWRIHLDGMVSKWLSRLNQAAPDYPEYRVQLDRLRRFGTDLGVPSDIRLLHCDYIGRNILVDSDNHVSGILDFEATRIGDAAYDLAKIVWVDMDFSDEVLRHTFLAGWEATYGEPVPRAEFLYYVGVQCLAAIAWTDKNIPLDNSNAFRSTAIRTLYKAVHELQLTVS